MRSHRGNGEEHDAVIAVVLLDQLDEVRQFGQAVTAPGGPEPEHHDLAGQIAEPPLGTVLVGEDEIGGCALQTLAERPELSFRLHDGSPCRESCLDDIGWQAGGRAAASVISSVWVRKSQNAGVNARVVVRRSRCRLMGFTDSEKGLAMVVVA